MPRIATNRYIVCLLTTFKCRTVVVCLQRNAGKPRRTRLGSAALRFSRANAIGKGAGTYQQRIVYISSSDAIVEWVKRDDFPKQRDKMTRSWENARSGPLVERVTQKKKGTKPIRFVVRRATEWKDKMFYQAVGNPERDRCSSTVVVWETPTQED